MAKTVVYSWRLDPALKRALDDAAKHEARPLSELLEDAARLLLDTLGQGPEQEEKARAAAKLAIGSIKSGQRNRSTSVRELVRAKLSERHGR